MSAVYKMAENYYRRGLWSRERLDKLVETGKLTEWERDKVVNGEMAEQSQAI